MELVYLWVEEYKNIYHQGFNFSSRFECEYKDDKLTINQKKDHVNIFPNNINITAIVGENGSGKSSVLSAMIMKSKIFIVVLDDELKIYTNKVKVTSSLKIEDLTTSFLRKVLYYSYSMDNLSLAESRSPLATINLLKTNELITTNYLKLQDIDSELFNFKPYYIEYSFHDFWLDSSYEIDDIGIEHIKSAITLNHRYDASDAITEAVQALKGVQDGYLLYLFNRFEGIEQIFEHIALTEKLNSKDFSLNVSTEKVQEALKKCGIDFEEKKVFDLLQENAGRFIKIQKLEELFGANYLELFFYKLSDQLKFDFMAENKATYSSLSDGEKTIYGFLVHLVNYNQQDFVFLLDEPDNTLHPDWQKRFLNEFIYLATKLEKKVHFIITSHSPFVISDLPKENVIFLEKDEKTGYCKNVTKETNIDTFGANIHTLLAHGFFMKDGLMGEFAKEKITKILRFLNNENKYIDCPIENIKPIIEMIGEDFLRNKLLNLYYKKFTNDEKERKKEILKQQIDNLQKQYAELNL
jgi:predicted ATPase